MSDRGRAAETAVPSATAAEGRAPPLWRQGVAAAGGLLGGLGAVSCCVLPLALFALGASGAWIGELAALAPYQPIFIAVSVASIGAGFVLVYRRPTADCGDGACRRAHRSRRLVKGALWSGSAMVLAALAFPYAAPLLLDV